MIRMKIVRGIAAVLATAMLAVSPISAAEKMGMPYVEAKEIVFDLPSENPFEESGVPSEESEEPTGQGSDEAEPGEDTPDSNDTTPEVPNQNDTMPEGEATPTDPAQGEATPTDPMPEVPTPTDPVKDETVELSFSSHVQGIGWQSPVEDGMVSGTLGEGKRVEAFRIDLKTELDLGIEYKSYVLGYGWEESWKSAGEISGTIGEAKPVEAIAIRLVGEDAEKFDLYYAAHVQKMGWLGYVMNGEPAGNSMDLRMEAFTIALRKKGEEAPNNKGTRTLGFAKADISYSTHIQGIGWQNYVLNGELSGTEGQARRLEAIKINLDTNLDVRVEYRTHIQGIGWESEWKSNNELSGTSGQSKRLEAIQIRLVGEDANLFDLYYRVHAQKFGWLDYTMNGRAAGTSGFSLRLEALRIRLVPRGAVDRGASSKAYVRENVTYRTHMQSTGWTGYSMNGVPSGVTGAQKRMEAFSVKTDGTMDIAVEYRSHIQGIGWERSWKTEGLMSGTSGEGRRVEAIQIRLSGADSDKFDIYYSAHVQKFGWMGWAKNGDTAGTMGLSLRIEAIRIKIVPKGSAAPAQLGSVSTPKCEAKLNYTFTGDARACSFAASIEDSGLGGEIIYRLYEPDDEWMYYRKNGTKMTAVHGAERIQMDLNGQLGQYFDIYYRAKVDGLGWSGWARNGQDAGSFFMDSMIVGVEAKIVPKYEDAPGSTENRTFQKFNSQAEVNMYKKAQNYYTTNGKLILVSRADHLVGIFDGYEGNYNVEKFFVCTVGAPGSETITGDFRMGIKMYYFDSDDARLFYASQIYGNYLFHSVLYYQDDYPRSIMDGRLGMDLSHGCVRLDVSDAKYIYNNIPGGTRILIY